MPFYHSYAGNLIPRQVEGFNDPFEHSVILCQLDYWENGQAWYGEQGWIVGATSTAAGAAAIEFNGDPDAYAPVTPGQRYYGAVWSVAVDNIAYDIHATLEWYDASKATLGRSAEQIWAIPGVATNGSRRVSVQAVAPASAAFATLRVKWYPTAAGQVVYFDTLFIGDTVDAGRAGNLLTYDEAFAASDGSESLWTATNATLGRTADAYIPDVFDGTALVSVTPTGTSVATAQLARDVPATPGEVYTSRVSVLVKQESNPLLRIRMRTRMVFLSSGSTLTTHETDWVENEASGAWILKAIPVSASAPPGTTDIRLSVDIDPNGSDADTYYVHDAYVTQSSLPYTVEVHEDGGYISVTALSIDDPVLNLLSVWRIHQDGTQVPIRTYDGDSVAQHNTGTGRYEDYEAPPGERVWYRIRRYDENGTGSAEWATNTVVAPGVGSPDYVWVKSPGLPALSVRAVVESPITWSRASRSAVYPVVGRSTPVVVTERRRAREGTLTLLGWTERDNEALNQVLDLGAPVLIQAAPGLGIRGNLYAHVGDVTEAPVSSWAQEEIRRWTLPLTEVSRPAGPLQGTRGFTWAAINDFYADWAAVADQYESWLDVYSGYAE